MENAICTNERPVILISIELWETSIEFNIIHFKLFKLKQKDYHLNCAILLWNRLCRTDSKI